MPDDDSSSSDDQEFPLDALPPWLEEMAREVARSSQTDPAMPATVGLSVLSASVAKKARVVMPGASFPLHLWTTVVAGPGEAKSKVFGAMSAPLDHVQEAITSPVSVDEGDGTSPLVHREPRYAHLDSFLDDDDDTGVAEASQPEAVPSPPEVSLAAVSSAIAARQVRFGANVPVVLVENDITPTVLYDLLAEQVSAVLLVSPEAGFEDWLTGGRVASVEQSAMNQIWDGDSRSRRRRDRVMRLRHPALSMAIAMQPVPASAFASNHRLRGVGFTLRSLWCLPRSTRGWKLAPFPSSSGSIFESYAAHLRFLLRIGWDVRPDRPHGMDTSPAATRVFNEFFNELEVQIRPNGELSEVADVVERLRTNVPRIAGCLHIGLYAAERGEGVFLDPIDEDTMNRAVRIGRWFLNQAISMFSMNRAAGLVQVDFVSAIDRFMSGRDDWTGTASSLLDELKRSFPSDSRGSDWPGGPQALSSFLHKNERILLNRGVGWSRRSGRERRIHLFRVDDVTSDDDDDDVQPEGE